MRPVPPLRIRQANEEPLRSGDYVLYWMTAFRRPGWNFALQRAVELAQECSRPLIILEALRCDYHWASDRLHAFVIQGMADNQRAFAARAAARYYPYLEPERGAGKGLLAALAKNACAVVGDDFPSFFLPRMVAAAAKQTPCRLEMVDSNGLLPLRAADKIFARAHDFRRFLQKNLRPHLDDFPEEDPLKYQRLPDLKQLPASITRRWPAVDIEALRQDRIDLSQFPLDHAVKSVAMRGGCEAGEQRLADFLAVDLPRYDEKRNEPEQEATSRLSPYLHFGHVSAHQVFHAAMARENWTPDQLADKATGSSAGWWGASEPLESFLDELITWREVGYNRSWQQESHDQYESLPEWAKTTLAEHAFDPREHTYSLEEFAASQTHDPLWNAAQRQLVREGRIHNYLRMLWGKKILQWTPSPEEALEVMIELNNKYALDGRNPNSYSGIFWVLGRYDRAWGPERPIFGKVRYMTSENTARKYNVKQYLRTYSASSRD
ncbi:cryptochrome/DNA photolyase family protein [Lignipirellula cremea]|uniref:Deoxyribodipyrimidine photo-lyase n=1 Tax=Lignipirellula cremea TaxID=2528010 RepID=A0A518DNK9_9BACT|nr:deoxyribodipyrimidine photolyase [Lignipirellula cremea]QDU93428.1 deoxyribodipyrimidine photolyase [Lignipirellula cremea]